MQGVCSTKALFNGRSNSAACYGMKRSMHMPTIFRRRKSRGALLALLSIVPVAAASGADRWGSGVLRQSPEWYARSEAREIADSVVQYQSPLGGWPKNTDLATPPQSPDDISSSGRGRANSLDNNATTLPIQFLARVAHATGEARYRDSLTRGVDYLLAAQYPGGGWPQFWPLRKGYYSHITFNDGAMIHAMNVLRDVAAGEPPYDFVDKERRKKAADAVSRGIDCILQTQVRQNGKLTAWCAQHDQETLEPAWARAYEPPSLSGCESVDVVRFLMSIDDPSREVIDAVEGAVAWFQLVAMNGVRQVRVRDDDGRTERRLVQDPAAPPLWARFYELETNRPLYVDRDSVFRYDYSQISYERRSGYSYHGTWAARLLEQDYPKWRRRLGVKNDGLSPEGKHRSNSGDAAVTQRRWMLVSSDIDRTSRDDCQSWALCCWDHDAFAAVSFDGKSAGGDHFVDKKPATILGVMPSIALLATDSTVKTRKRSCGGCDVFAFFSRTPKAK